MTAKKKAESAKLTAASVELPAGVFGVRASGPTVHQGVVRQRAGRRRGTQKTKARGEVRGGGRKPWKQKGTGRARAGSRRSPLWRGGAMIHAISPRSYEQDMPRKMRRAALRGALSERAKEGAVTVVESLDLAEPKTRLVEALLNDLGVESAVFIGTELSRNFVLGARNHPAARLLTPDTLNAEDVLGYERVIITKDALAKLEGVLGANV